MNISIKQIAASLVVLFTLVGGVVGATKYLVTRDTFDFYIADLQKGQQNLKLDRQQSTALNWYRYYQLEVERLSAECARDPQNVYKRNYLNQMKMLRDNAKHRLDSLMNQ